MKVLYVTKALPYGMAEAHILPEIREHLEAGWDIRIAPLVRERMLHSNANDLLERTYDEPLISGRIVAGALATAVKRPGRALGALREVFGSRNLNLLFRNLAAYPKGLWLAGEVMKADFDHIHSHWAAVPASLATIAAYVSETPFSITSHRYDIAQRNVLNWKARDAVFIRCTDDMGWREFSAALKPDRRRPVIIHLSVVAAPEAVAVRPGVLSPLRAVAGSRFVEKKGLEYLIRGVGVAKREGVRVELDLFGDGPLEASLRALTEELGLADQIAFKGPASHTALLAGLRSGDYDSAALTSVLAADGDKEGVPAFLIEAASAGLPLVTTPNGSILELAGEGRGIVCAERDSEAIGLGFVRIATDEAERRRLAAAARERMLSEFDIKRSARRLRALMTGEETPAPPPWLAAEAPAGPFAKSHIRPRAIGAPGPLA